ncbi:MAG: hypothetical protein ACD_76C00054G0001 [uncultured bacterium]|nr:MAG: hypothetical protein ACD_76C00054G0001 [uncultured bacterium]HBD05637.1 hypothetical protein [Candidatus Uhrbacteria bacterium]
MKSELVDCTPIQAVETLFSVINFFVTGTVVQHATVRDKLRTGGWFAFWRKDPNSGSAVPIVGFAVGMVSAERFLKYMRFANEKAARLGSRPGDISSWQSRDVSDRDRMNHKTGGAIRCGDGLIFSFSGFSEHEDEAICLFIAQWYDFIDMGALNSILAASNNKMFERYQRESMQSFFP